MTNKNTLVSAYAMRSCEREVCGGHQNMSQLVYQGSTSFFIIFSEIIEFVLHFANDSLFMLQIKQGGKWLHGMACKLIEIQCFYCKLSQGRSQRI